MNLYEHIELECAGDVVEFMQFFIVESRYDEENGVSSRYDGFVDLNFMNHKIFSEQGDGGEFSYLGQVGEVALEVFFFREDGHAGCTAVNVHACLTDWVKIGIDNTNRRGGFFHLSDDTKLIWAAIECGAKTTKVISLKCGGLQFLHARNDGFDLLPLVVHDFSELVHVGTLRMKSQVSRLKFHDCKAIDIRGDVLCVVFLAFRLTKVGLYAGNLAL